MHGVEREQEGSWSFNMADSIKRKGAFDWPLAVCSRTQSEREHGTDLSALQISLLLPYSSQEFWRIGISSVRGEVAPDPAYDDRSYTRTSILVHWMAAVSVTKAYIPQSLFEGTKYRISAQLEARTGGKSIIPVVTMGFSQYQICYAWMARLPHLTRYLADFCMGKAGQAALVNAFGRFKLAAATADMPNRADITGIYKREFFDEIKEFRKKWAAIENRDDLNFLGMTDSEAIRPVQGREWNHLHTLAKIRCERTYGLKAFCTMCRNTTRTWLKQRQSSSISVLCSYVLLLSPRPENLPRV
nr:hypothetical protein HmN_000542800 [Hymenolepis microstoma]